MFFALDSAQSWLARPNPANSRHPGDGYAVVSEVARRAGLKMVRDRLSWGECEPAPGKFNWRQYMTNATLLSERGIQLSGMYHDAPKWAKTNTTHLPGDLVATYRFAKKLAETFRGKMAAWEFWNEQDIGFAPEGAWDYASALKAAYLGFKASPSPSERSLIPTCRPMRMSSWKMVWSVTLTSSTFTPTPGCANARSCWQTFTGF